MVYVPFVSADLNKLQIQMLNREKCLSSKQQLNLFSLIPFLLFFLLLLSKEKIRKRLSINL